MLKLIMKSNWSLGSVGSEIKRISVLREIFKNEDRDFCVHRHEALGPTPPLRVQFCENKINHHFLEIEYMIAKTNFTLGPIKKSIF